MKHHIEKSHKVKPLILLSFLALMALVLMGCGGPDINEEEAAAEAYDRFGVVLDKAGWTNLNYGPGDFSATLEDKELTLVIGTGGFYNFVEGLEQNYSYYRNIGIYTLEENGKHLFEEHDDLELLRVILWSSGTDEFGERKDVNNLVLSLNRENFSKINWDGLEQQMLFGNLDTSIFDDAYIRGS